MTEPNEQGAEAVAKPGADTGPDTGADTATETDAVAVTEEPLPPPCIAGIAPAAALAGQGASVSILGDGFAERCAVQLGDAALVSQRMSARRLEALVPAQPAGEVTLAVVNPDGQTATVSMRFEEAPAIAGIAPVSGSTGGGDELTLTGRRFVEGCVVEIGGERAAQVIFEDATRLRAVTPAHDGPGPVEVAVINPSGLAQRLRDAYHYVRAAPRIEAVSPAEVPSAGGTRLAVRGSGFEEGCAVIVCGIPAAVTFKGREELEVIAPPVSRDGPADIRVVNPDDQAHTAEKAFRYRAALPPPVLREVSPTRCPQDGGIKVSILGENFAEPVVVRFGGLTAQVEFLTHKELSAIAPAHASAGEVAIDVVNPDGATVSLEAAFTYEAKPGPSITSVHPANGPGIGGTRLVIEGEHFGPGAFVYIGREPPKDTVVKSTTEIHIVTPPRKAAGVVDIEVGVPGLPKAVKKNAFRYDAVPPPSISSVAPNRGGVAGGTELTISGQNFLKETAVLIDGKPVKSVKLVDKSTLEVKTPPGEANKLVDVAVRNPDGKEAVQKRAFMYDPRYG